jgi:hypothetical protein
MLRSFPRLLLFHSLTRLRFLARHAKSCLPLDAIGCSATTPASETPTQVQYYIESQVLVPFLKELTPTSYLPSQIVGSLYRLPQQAVHASPV